MPSHIFWLFIYHCHFILKLSDISGPHLKFLIKPNRIQIHPMEFQIYSFWQYLFNFQLNIKFHKELIIKFKNINLYLKCKKNFNSLYIFSVNNKSPNPSDTSMYEQEQAYLSKSLSKLIFMYNNQVGLHYTRRAWKVSTASLYQHCSANVAVQVMRICFLGSLTFH